MTLRFSDDDVAAGVTAPERAATIATDSIAQAAAYRPPMLLAGTRHADLMVPLGAVLAGAAPGRQDPAEVTLFCSVGLAGTEVFPLDRLAGGSGGSAGGPAGTLGGCLMR